MLNIDQKGKFRFYFPVLTCILVLSAIVIANNLTLGNITEDNISSADNITELNLTLYENITAPEENITEINETEPEEELVKEVPSIEITHNKIQSNLREELSSLPADEVVKVLVKVNEKKNLEDISDLASVKGDVKGAYELGSVIVLEIPINELESIADEYGVDSIWPVDNYTTMLDTSIPFMQASSMWNLGYNGSGVKIAVLDTGVNVTHPMLVGRITDNAVFTREDNYTDGHGHGTHCTGIAAGSDSSEGFKGVAHGASIMNGKVLTDSGSGTTDWIIAGINWAVDNGADVISMSLGSLVSYDSESPLTEAINDAIDAGVIVVVASGNCGEVPSASCGSFDGVTFPGSVPSAITVGAVNIGLGNFSYAAYSSGEDFTDYIKPDVVAPGTSVNSSYYDGTYKVYSGTSMATPHVAGAAAILRQVNSGINQSLVKAILEYWGEQGVNYTEKNIYYGSGFVNLSLLDTKELYTDESVSINDKSLILNLSNYGVYDLNITSYSCASCTGIELNDNIVSLGELVYLNLNFTNDVTIDVVSDGGNKSINVNYINPNETLPVIDSVSLSGDYFTDSVVGIVVSATDAEEYNVTVTDPNLVEYDYSSSSVNFTSTSLVGSYLLNVSVGNDWGEDSYSTTFTVNNYKFVYPEMQIGTSYNVILTYKNVESTSQDIDADFYLDEYDSFNYYTDSNTIAANTTENFSFSWTPSLIGKHTLDVYISNSTDLLEGTTTALPVNGTYVDNMVGLNVRGAY